MGSKFYFDLPVKLCVKELIDNSNVEDTSLETSQNLKAHVLIVEDNKTNQMLMGMILEDLEITYDIANDGAEGVLSFKQSNYDVVLMDENMPNMNGIEATKRIRELEKEQSLTATPIIAVTANALSEDRQRFLAAGMDDYISKPYGEEDIVKVLQKFLRSSQ